MNNYAKNAGSADTLDRYTCKNCGARGIKLWRSSSARQPGLLCAGCVESLHDRNLDWGRSDQIGGWFPATSPSQEGVRWWHSLPTRPVSSIHPCDAVPTIASVQSGDQDNWRLFAAMYDAAVACYNQSGRAVILMYGHDVLIRIPGGRASPADS